MASAARRGAAEPQLWARAAGGLASTTGCFVSRPQNHAATTLQGRYFVSKQRRHCPPPPAAIGITKDQRRPRGTTAVASGVQGPHHG